MIATTDWQQICKSIEKASKQPFTIKKISPISGGCINSAYQLHGHNINYFIKLNKAALVDMFAAEFSGLIELAKQETVKVPRPIVYGTSGEHAFLALEMLSFTSTNKLSEQQLAQQLAALHQIRQAFFGWYQDNTIGSTAQCNNCSDDWVSFWRNNRLGFQLSLAEKNNYKGNLIYSGEKLCGLLHHFFSNYQPQPSLLHGDLWSGNIAVTTQGEPVIFDPACYYGDRETDIAMTELFGGFSTHFYKAYQHSYPLDPGYNTRKTLYNLYHILNHLNLFGASYLSQAQQMIDNLLSEVA